MRCGGERNFTRLGMMKCTNERNRARRAMSSVWPLKGESLGMRDGKALT